MHVPFSQILGEKSPLKLPDLELLEALGCDLLPIQEFP